jgi:hypothetical protein
VDIYSECVSVQKCSQIFAAANSSSRKLGSLVPVIEPKLQSFLRANNIDLDISFKNAGPF